LEKYGSENVLQSDQFKEIALRKRLDFWFEKITNRF
jgi:hypothetical protein